MEPFLISDSCPVLLLSLVSLCCRGHLFHPNTSTAEQAARFHLHFLMSRGNKNMTNKSHNNVVFPTTTFRGSY